VFPGWIIIVREDVVKVPDFNSRLDELVDYVIDESMASLAGYGITGFFAEAMAIAIGTIVAVCANLMIFAVAALVLYQLVVYDLQTLMVYFLAGLLVALLWVNLIGFHLVARVVRRIKHWKN
jgi:hypothetical protein